MSAGKVLVVVPLPDPAARMLRERFDLVQVSKGSPGVLTDEDRRAVRAVLTNGSTGFSASAMAAFPNLGLVACFGAGFEGVDLEAARSRGIVVTYAPNANSETVADHALGLMLALMRDIPARDAAVRAGKFATSRGERPTLSRSVLGVLGLGRIGDAIAQRGAAFGMSVAYTTRHPRPGRPWHHVPDLKALARESDVLVAACPGGAATRHLVDADVLSALGPQGFLVNIARGSVVRTEELAAALKSGTIAGAALDVWEGEPDLPASLRDAPNLIVTPHMAGRSPAAIARQVEILAENLDALFAGRPLAPDTLAAPPAT